MRGKGKTNVWYKGSLRIMLAFYPPKLSTFKLSRKSELSGPSKALGKIYLYSLHLLGQLLVLMLGPINFGGQRVLLK